MFSGGAYAAWMARASDDNVCGRTGPWGTGGERWPVCVCGLWSRGCVGGVLQTDPQERAKASAASVERTKLRVGTY